MNLIRIVKIVFTALFISATFWAAADPGGSDESESAPAYSDAAALVEEEQFAEAIPVLLELAQSDEANPDIYNLLGYSHRRLEKFTEALDYYRTALELDPMHLGANEYLGELHLKMDDVAMAEERLVVLQDACPEGCEQLDDLLEAIQMYNTEGSVDW